MIKNTLQDFHFEEGEILLIDKPLNWTSFDVVNKIRYRLRRLTNNKKIKVGHAGTLDPLATGLLIVCTGKMTKSIDQLMAQTKGYAGTITLGATRPSYDMETEIDATFPTAQLNDALLTDTSKQFLGHIEQLPPMFSAIKVDGQKLYEAARKGEVIDVPTRQVHIEKFDISPLRDDFSIDFDVICAKGTYIRSLAYDFGKACGSGAYLSRLHRTSIGDYLCTDAWQLDDLIALLDNG